MPIYNPSGGVSSTVLKTLVDPQVNISSVGDTYTDTAGNTYAETTNQTRITTNAVYKRYVALKVSGHVSAGTGSYELRNYTQSTSGTAVTTTATSEAAIAATTVTVQVTTLADVITIRVKNSGAGGTTTIDSGGMVEADSLVDVSTTGYKNTIATLPGWANALKYLSLAGLSTASVTVQPVYSTAYITAFNYLNMGSPSSTLNTVINIPLTQKLYLGAGSQIQLNISALTGQILMAIAGGLSTDNI
jgi:hypothetical protein